MSFYLWWLFELLYYIAVLIISKISYGNKVYAITLLHIQIADIFKLWV